MVDRATRRQRLDSSKQKWSSNKDGGSFKEREWVSEGTADFAAKTEASLARGHTLLIKALRRVQAREQPPSALSPRVDPLTA